MYYCEPKLGAIKVLQSKLNKDENIIMMSYIIKCLESILLLRLQQDVMNYRNAISATLWSNFVIFYYNIHGKHSTVCPRGVITHRGALYDVIYFFIVLQSVYIMT